MVHPSERNRISLITLVPDLHFPFSCHRLVIMGWVGRNWLLIFRQNQKENKYDEQKYIFCSILPSPFSRFEQHLCVSISSNTSIYSSWINSGATFNLFFRSALMETKRKVNKCSMPKSISSFISSIVPSQQQLEKSTLQHLLWLRIYYPSSIHLRWKRKAPPFIPNIISSRIGLTFTKECAHL